MSPTSYDLVVIGSGPGGYVAAIRAAHLGLKTAIVEKDPKLGGTCLLRGCIPTKSLLHSADLLDEVRGAAAHGVIAEDVRVDFAGVQKARKKVVTKSAAGVAYLMKQNGIDVHTGHGSFAGPKEIVVDDGQTKKTLAADNVVIATGSVPRSLPFIDIDGEHFVTSDHVLELEQPPGSLIVLGAGAVGVEFASVYRRFGSEVTVVEMLERPLPIEDAEISEEFRKAFKKRGIEILTSAKLESAEVRDGRVVASVATGDSSRTLEADKLLVAVGRAPVTDGLCLSDVGVRTDDGGYIEVDEMMRTSAAGVYAIGDVVRTPWLAHIASAEGLVAVDHMAGKEPAALNYDHTPGCTYTDPEVASVGLTEAAARERGYDVKIGKFPFAALGKARIMGKTEGFVKVVAESKYDELLGVHIIGPRATDLIAEACVALRLESTTAELAHTIHAHPTLSEAVLEAAHGAQGRPIHL